MRCFIKAVTEKCEGGWQVRVVRTNLFDVNAGYLLENRDNGIFSLAEHPFPGFAFPSRSAAREALAGYKVRVTHIRVIGGLH